MVFAPFSPSRLHAPRHFERQLRRLIRHLPPEEDAFPSAALLAREAPFLLEQYRQLKKALKACPALPMEGKEPRLLPLARKVCGHLPLHKGRMLMQIRSFYQHQDMRCREKDMLPAALSLALLEQVQEQMKNALQIAGEDVVLLRQRSLSLTLQALHETALFSFAAFGEHICPVSALLKKDDTFRLMDRESRNHYVDRVCRLARRYCVAETAVARAALALCQGKEGVEKEAGYYLLEQPELIAAYLMKKSPSLSRKQKTLFFLLPFAGAALLCCLFFAYVSGPVLLLPFGLLAASEHVRKGWAFLLRHFSPPRMLPRLHPRQVKEKRLLVAVPALLSDEKQAFALARHLRTLHAATPQAHFMLLADFPDGNELLPDRDLALCRTTAAIFQALNQQEANAYLYFHRSRIQLEQVNRYAARRGKQGAIETLNQLLLGEESPDTFVYSSLPPSALHNKYDHVLLLHPDTFLPPGAAEQLQGALEHPLQKGRMAMIRPRMACLSSSLRTHLQFLLHAGGPENPSHATEQILHPFFGRASFSGQGIYDPALVLRRTHPLQKKHSLRHHYFLEGELATCGFSEDILCFAPPAATLSRLQNSIRQNARGDGQLASFLTDAALPFISRFRIYDRLRFLFVPVSQLALMVSGALLQNPFLMLLGLPYPFSGMVRRLCLMPGTAFIQMAAFFKKTSSAALSLGCTLSSLLSGAAAVIFSLLPGGVVPGLVPGLCFLLPPLFLPYLDQKRPLHPPLSEEDHQALRSLCRDTWHFFEKNVHAGTFHLPPDFVQHQPDIGPSRHTSPSAIGLYLLSVLAAREMNLISTCQMLRRQLHAVESMEKMETWQGHFFRAYSLDTLLPASPDISTADSGVLCACLLACAQGVRSHLTPSDAAFASLPERMDHLAHAMRFDTLFDSSLSLFFTGYDTKAHQPTAAHHDLLASESRLASFAAIRMGQVPVRHWFRLARPITRQGGGAALLSRHGSAGEYLLPGLLMPFYPKTLLKTGCLNALRAQVSAALHRPFGLSTSGHFAFSPSLQYLSRPFGLPSLSLAGEGEKQVVAPYASMLALPYLPGAALRNLKKMRSLSWYGEDGLFEAADYAPSPMETGPHLVQSHVAAHQAMILCAACNLLTDFSLVHHFMLPAPAMAHHYLLCEKAPPCPRPSRPLPKAAPAPVPGYAYAFPAAKETPSAALPLFGKDTVFLMNGRGNSLLKLGSAQVSPFHPSSPCGLRYSLRHGKTGALFCPQSQGQIFFETGCIRIPFRAFGLKGCMRFFVLPLDGALVADLTLENPGTLEEAVDVLSFLELETAPFSEVSIRPHGENALLCRREAAGSPLPLLCHSLAGDVQGIHPPEDGAKPCLALTGRLFLPAGGKAHVQFVTRTAPLEADLPETAQLLPPAALALCETASRMALRYANLSPSALPLYGRMLGFLYFEQPQSCPYPPAPAQFLHKYGLSGQKPLLTVHLQKPDRALIRHLLSAHAFFETAGLETEVLFLCNESSLEALEALLSQQKGLFRAVCPEKEVEKLASLSALHLKSGTPLAAQLDALTHPSEFPSLRPMPTPGEQPPLLPLRGRFAGFTEEMDLCLFALPPAPFRHLLMGQGFATVTGEKGVLHSFSPEKAEEYLLVSDTGAYSLTEGLMLCRPGVTQYHCRPMGVQCKCTLFSHASLPVNLRQITLQSPTEITCALRCMVRFSEKSGVIATRRDAPFAYAAFSHRRGIAFAHMENAALFTLPPCHTGAADAAAFHTEGASVAVFETPLHLLPHRPLSLCLTVGYAPDEQAARRMTEAAHHQGVCDALRQVGLFWQEKLERLLIFGGAPELTPLLNRWLPYWARCAERENAASSFPDGLLSLLCCLHTDAPHARQQLLLCAGNQEEPLLLPFLTALYAEITGDKAILQEKLKWPDAPSLLQQCLSLLHSVEYGPHGLPQTAHPLWHPGHYETAESVALGFFLCMAYARFAPLCDGETGKRLMEHRQGLLSRLEQAWLENEYLPGWDGKGLPLAKTIPMGQMCACLACLAGAPREHARLALHHALAHPPSPGLSPLLVMALCNTGACEDAWQMARHALPSFLPGEKAGRAAPAALMYYVYITKLLGLEKKGNQVRLMPCPGGDLEEFSLVLRHHSSAYHLTAGRDILFPTLDGEKIKTGWVTLRDDGRTHEARFPHRKA